MCPFVDLCFFPVFSKICCVVVVVCVMSTIIIELWLARPLLRVVNFFLLPIEFDYDQNNSFFFLFLCSQMDFYIFLYDLFINKQTFLQMIIIHLFNKPLIFLRNLFIFKIEKKKRFILLIRKIIFKKEKRKVFFDKYSNDYF